jgi:hypothetical protein
MLHRAIVMGLLILTSSPGAADPIGDVSRPSKYVQTEAPRLLCMPPTPPDRCIELPIGRFVDEGAWGRLDVELRRLQDAETRLKAENVSLKGSLSGWSPGWRTIIVAISTGLAGGIYVGSKL